jgi:hypothetical protein
MNVIICFHIYWHLDKKKNTLFAQEAIVAAMPGDEPDEETDRWLPMAIGVGTLESARVLRSTLLAVFNLLGISYLSL